MGMHVNKKGQALIELAIFGSLILFLFGVLISNMQRLNDQQYVQMETFRRTLQIANNGGLTPAEETLGGAAAQLTILENRRQVDLSGYFMKGSSQSVSSSSNVFWAVPAVGVAPTQRTYVKVNEDYSPDLFEEEPIENIDSVSETSFSETLGRQETPEAITSAKSSTLKDKITTTLVDKDKKKIWETTQGLHRDDDGQYRYSQAEVDAQVDRSQTWQTGF